MTVLALIGVMYLVRGLTPSDLLDNDQLKPAGYLLDIVIDGQWLVQTDFFGNIASKPPLHTWVAALAVPVFGATEWALAVPGVIGMLLGCLAIWMISTRTLGHRVAWLATFAWLFSFFGFKHVWLARTDGLYAGLTALAVALAWRACADAPRRGSGDGGVVPQRVKGVSGVFGPWLWVWLALGLATLTKGPLAIVFVGFAVFGLAMTTARSWMRGGHAVGVVALLMLAGGWFVAALLFGGQGVYDKLIGDELVGHAFGTSKGHLQDITTGERLWEFAQGLFKPTLYGLWNTVPWSVAWAIGVWRAIARPAGDGLERRLELMCLCWFGLGVALLSVVPHQRPDHLLPLIPAAAILAGREIGRWIEGWSAAGFRAALIAAVVLAFGGAWLNYAVLVSDAWYIRRQEALEQLARELEARDDVDARRIVFVDASAGLQFLLRNNNERVSAEVAAGLLAGGDGGAFAIRDVEAFLNHFDVAVGDRERLVVLAQVRKRRAGDAPAMEASKNEGNAGPLAGTRGALVVVLGFVEGEADAGE